MKSNLLKFVLLGLLGAVTLLSLSHGPRANVAARQSSAQTGTQTAARSSPPQPPSSEKWGRYTYPGEEFSVEMPEMPFVSESLRSVGPTETERVRTFGLYSGGVIYMVTSYDNPRAQETLDYFAGYEWSDPSFKAARELKLSGFEGREYESARGYVLRARVFRTKRHAYRVRAMGYGTEDPRVARFLDSLTLGGKPAGVAIREQSPVAYGVPVEPPPVLPPGPGRGGAVGPAQGQSSGEQQQRESATPAHAAGEPYKPSEVARKAIIVFKPEPGYTEEARRNNIQGVVRIRAVFAAEGIVRGMSVVKGLPNGLTEKAIGAARHILFFPAEAEGHAVSQYVTLEYNFQIY